ncbi:MAG: 3-hydroxyacyl-CoA dehydrogenase [Proteobacteria bacterium]|nr:3-hydroxyacyl-CoA dehydrogenase [Pseudomonadota bacterium]
MPTIGLVGVGLIGRAWANVFSRAGWDVKAWDANPKATAEAPRLVADSLHDLARHGLVKEPEAAARRVKSVATLEEAVAGVDFVQESGPETIDAKLEIWKKMDAAAAPETILVSSSSAITASRFTADLKGRARCLIAHPVNPPHVVPIVELCPAPWTSPDVVKRARAIYEGVGQVPMELKKEIDGFILNRMQAVLLSEAFRLVSEGYCSAEDLDKTIAHGLGLRWSFMGPFETIEMNAPGGIPDYCKRFSKTMAGLASRPYSGDQFEPENVERIMASWGKTPTAEQVAKKSRWRDERLAALQAHKLKQAKFEG